MSMQQGQRDSHVIVGVSAADIYEREVGCTFDKAAKLEELRSALYTVGEEFGYDDENEVAIELARRCREFESLTCRCQTGGGLTLHRECSRCSGGGKTKGEDPCIDCAGRGYIHAEEADH